MNKNEAEIDIENKEQLTFWFKSKELTDINQSIPLTHIIQPISQ
jgi:hypothetical protein